MKCRDSPIIYIASKYAGDTERNIQAARRYCRHAIEKGCVPIAPHLLLPQFLSEETERDLAIAIDLRLLSLCEELWACGGISEGMRREIDYAKKTGIPVRYIREEDVHVRDK